MKISICIPVYNGAKTIAPLVGKLKEELLMKYKIEIVLVNDGSNDNSSEVCEMLAKSDSLVKFINLSRNFGEHNAVMAGLNYCTGDCAVIMDDDFQTPPEEVSKLIAKLNEGYDVVFSSYGKKQHNVFRNIGSKFNNFIATIMIKKPYNLYLSSFKVINRFLIDNIIKFKGPYPYVDGLILRITRKYATVHVSHAKRVEGKSGYTLKKLISLWLTTFTNFSVLPLRFATIAGFLFALISLCGAIFVTIEKIMDPSLPVGWASLIVSLFLVASVQMFAIGIVGEYLGRLFMKSTDMPQFIVRDTFNYSKEI